MLSRIRLSPMEIKRSLLSLDDSKLSVDELKVIARHLPTPDEVRIAQNVFLILSYLKVQFR